MNIVKLTYITGIALLLASCAGERDDDPIFSKGNKPILFNTSLPAVTSRAQVVTKENLDYFHVTSFNPSDPKLEDGHLEEFFRNVLVEKDDDTDQYKSDYCIWPSSDQEANVLTFFAYYPAVNGDAKLDNSSTVSGGIPDFNYKITNFSVAQNIAEQTDFITAWATGSMKDNLLDGINLEFKHQLSRVEVKAKNTGNSYKIEIAGILIGGTYSEATFDFKPKVGAGDWILGDVKKNVQYIYSAGDKIVTIENTLSGVSIMGCTQYDNYAMLLPSEYTGWNYENDKTNLNQGLYLGVLLRVVDTKGKQQYPYTDTYQGPDALDIPKVYLAVDGGNTVMSGQLYKGEDGTYFTDSDMTTAYTLPQGSTVREFGWSAIPISGDWKPGYFYTYTLDYTYGIGLHAPDVKPSKGPNAGDPIFSDKVGLTVSVKGWQNGSVSSSSINVPESI